MDVGSNTNMQIIKEKEGSKSSYELKQKQHNNSNNYNNNNTITTTKTTKKEDGKRKTKE